MHFIMARYPLFFFIKIPISKREGPQEVVLFVVKGGAFVYKIN